VSEGLSSRGEAALLRSELRRPAELALELAGVAEMLLVREDLLELRRPEEADIVPESLTLLSICVSALALTLRESVNELLLAFAEECERIEPPASVEASSELRLSLVLSSSAIQNSRKSSRPCASFVTSFRMRIPVRLPLFTTTSLHCASSSDTASKPGCKSAGASANTVATTRFLNCTPRSVTWRPVPWRWGVGRLPPT
jgi:hypothetical protein